MRIILIIIFLAAALGIFWFMTRPYYFDIKELQNNQSRLNEGWDYLQKFQKTRDDLLSKYNAIDKQNINRLNQMLVSKLNSDSLVMIMVMLENRVKANGLLLKAIGIDVNALGNTDANKSAQTTKLEAGEINDATVDKQKEMKKPAAVASHKNIPFSLSVSGSYSSFVRFLSDLERSLRLIDVDSIAFSAEKARGAGDIYEFAITAKTYYLPADISLSSSVFSDAQNMDPENILAILNKIKKIGIDSDFFRSEIFQSFSDFSPALGEVKEYGRVNPFAPLETSFISAE